ncbi:MAG TPA: Gfo/Idh/MocA family oxidoreductase [Burkholderiales bacterium]|jgi:predicted dehydrogenase|nr:Gfo/Idh/MocA family oxidoreductase [Burkholderiales bacterium]
MIQAAIVGLGTWGQHLVSAVQGKSDVIRFTAGATRTPSKAADFCARHGIRLFPTYEEILKDGSVEAVVLATPHSTHAEQIAAAAKAGKHVFVEKPLGLSRADCELVVASCAERNVTLAVGYNWRFQPALREIKRMLEDGRLGKLLHIEGNFCGPSAYRFRREHWRQDRDEVPAGGMTGRGVHVVDAMLYLAGRIDSVVAQSARLVQDFGADDTTSMLFRFASGATGSLATVIATAETWRMQVFGSNGWAEVGDVEHLHTWSLRTCFIDRDNIAVKRPPTTTTFENMSTERAELEHFARAAQGHRRLAVPGGDEVHNVAVLEAIVKAAREGTRVSI